MPLVQLFIEWFILFTTVTSNGKDVKVIRFYLRIKVKDLTWKNKKFKGYKNQLL